jgi:long-chain acyl-CoA synthetase
VNRPWYKFYPKQAPYEVEIPLLSIYELLERSAQKYPDCIAVIDGDLELTYSELKKASDCFAAALYLRGVGKGERIALMLPNCIEYIISYYAIHRLGGVVVQVNPVYQSSELEYILQDSEALWMIGHDHQMKKLEKTGLANQVAFISANRNDKTKDSIYSWMEEENNEPPSVDFNPKEDLALLQYTGGTTGRSKGVMLTHFNLVANVLQDFSFTVNVLHLQTPGERMLGLTPLFHVFGNARLNSSVYTASTYITIDKFEINKVVDLIRKHRPTIFPGVPTMYIALLNYPDLTAKDLECFKYCSCGSAPLPIEVIHKFEQNFNIQISEGFGMSETSPTTHRNPVVGQRKPGSIGVPCPSTEAKIMDLENETMELPPGHTGELVIKGPQVMKGYWKNPGETSVALRDGWLYTGDIATMDEEGYFYIVGRKKDLIIASGFNIYPIEIENVIYQHPAVAEACVFGIPDPYRGETVKVAIVLKKGMRVTEEQIIEWCNERIARYKVPRLIEFREQLPKTMVGKILRRKLLEEEVEKLKAISNEENKMNGHLTI